MSDLAALPPHVRAYLKGYVLRGRRLALVRGAGVAACIFFGVLLLGCLADRFAHFAASVRWGLLVAAGLGAIVVLLRPLLRLSRPEVDWLAVADRIERQNPSFGQRLLTVASQLLGDSGYRGSDEMLGQLAHQLDQDAARQRPSRLLPARAVAGPWMLLIVFAAAAIGLGQMQELNLPQLALRFLAPWMPLPPVTTTTLAVMPGNQNVQQGAPVRIEARIDRLGGAPVWLYLAEGEQAEYRRVAMTIADETPAIAGNSTPAASRPSEMASGRPLRFTYTLGSVDRDVRYYVAAGDAVSDKGKLRVLRKPAVAEFRVRYTFPPYTGRSPVITTSTDGRIEAPVGTEVQLTLVATEALQVAMLSYAGEKQLLARPEGADERTRAGKFTLTRDGKLEIDLISTRDQAGTGPASAEVRALVDRPPVIRVSGAGQILRAAAREIVPIPYEALDDYGVESILLRAQAGATSVDIPVYSRAGVVETSFDSPRSDPRRRGGMADLDLAALPLSPGDLVSATLITKDSSSAVGTSDTLQILITPRSVGFDAYERTAELESAAQSAAAAADDLEAAGKALTESGPQADSGPAKGHGPVASGKSGRRLSAAAGASAMARRALLRAIAHDPSPSLSAVMMSWIDSAQNQAAVTEGLYREAVGDLRGSDTKLKADPKTAPETPPSSPRSRPSRPMLRDADQELAESARRLRDELRTASRAERAAILLADIETLRAAEKRGPQPPADKAAADRLRASTQRLRDEIGSSAKSLGLMDKGTFSMDRSADLSRKLKDVIEQGQRLCQSKSRFDLLPVVRDWAERIQRNSWQPITLDERLLAASQAEAVRPFGDARTARDYHLAGRAAAMIEARADRTKPVPVPETLANAYVQAFESLRREAQLNHAAEAEEGEVASQVKAATAAARRQMSEWAGEGDSVASATGPLTNPILPSVTMPSSINAGPGRVAKVEGIALQASADAADRNYPAVAAADHRLSQQASQAADAPSSNFARQAIEQARRSTDVARIIDELSAEQTRLAARVTYAGVDLSADEATSLAARQSALSGRIAVTAGKLSPVGNVLGSTPEGSARDRAGAAFTGVQGRLAQLPQQLADLLEADADHRSAAKRLAEARRELQEAREEQKPAARRMAEMAAREEAESAGRVTERLTALSPTVAQSMVAALDPFAADTPMARDTLSNRLTPAFRTLADAVRNDSGRDQAQRSADEIRKAAEIAQIALATSQAELADRDPLTGAKWYAKASADALARVPPDRAAAAKYQADAQVSLAKAWERSLRYAAAQRLSAARSIRPPAGTWPVAGTQPTTETGVANASPLRFPSLGTLAGEWRRLRQRDADEPSGMLREVEPAGYEAALKAYFEAIGKK